jgi:stage II sporulation protein P
LGEKVLHYDKSEDGKMKPDPKEPKLARPGFWLSLLSLIMAAALAAGGEKLLTQAALVSAGTQLPQGGTALLRRWLAVPTVPAPPALANGTTPAQGTAQLTAAPAAGLDLRETPADIRLCMEEAQTELANQVKDGGIEAVTYARDGATDSFGSVFVRNKTDTKKLDVQKELEASIPLTLDRTKPSVLIFHTHTTEGYEILDRDWYAQDDTSRSRNLNNNVARVGAAIAQSLEAAGFAVLHDTTIHDDQYSGAYDRSRGTVRRYLDTYPSLQVVLDVHRDAIHRDDGTKIKPVTTINGKKSAQIMIVTGAEENSITGYPNWQQNLRFALKLQKSCVQRFPSLMRPVFFCSRKYNMDMTPQSLLVEVGADANTLEEAVYAGRLFGAALADLMNSCVSQ